jgi:ornithine cyclodeaminase/alanine dehydrogenase-like protein (mu-crystallin family)
MWQGVGMVVKAVSVFAGNHGTETPSHQGVIVVFDEHDGTPLAIIDGTSVTALRTAASAAVAADVLARPDSTVLAIIGGGVQGHSHLTAFADLRPWSSVRSPLGRVARRSRWPPGTLRQRRPASRKPCVAPMSSASPPTPTTP